AAKYVKLTINSNWGNDRLKQYGLSEVRFFSIPVCATEPYPNSGATDVDLDVILGWKAGREAVTHNVSFSADEQAVIDGTAPVTAVVSASYTPPTLDLGSTYYWRVEEVNDAETPATWQGDVWGFTTEEFIAVEDFESFNDADDLVYDTWIDGFDNPAANGSTMGYTIPFEPTMETGIVHGGSQSAPMEYNNTAAALSEVTRTFAAPQDWTKHSVQTLTLWFRGAAGNTGQLYVKVNGSKVVYDGDAANLQLGWQAWNIELASFGVDLQSVTTLAIGVEGSGATGLLLLDDIRLYALSREFITPVQPDAAGLIGHWALDGNTQDSSGLANHGTAQGGPTYAAGKIGQAMSFDGSDDYVVIDGVAGDITSNDITLAAWVNMISAANIDWYPIISCNTAAGGNVGWLAVDDGFADFGNLTGTMLVTDDEWHHLAYTSIGGTGSLYVDGVLEGTHTATLDFSTDNNLWSIGQEWDGGPSTSDFFIGTVDDARIYNYGLSYAEVAGLAGRTLPFDKPF
ncbi:MAG: LamG domain-containing protein, partial [Phycisphaerales bacterium]